MEVLLEPIKGGWRAVVPRLLDVQAEAATQEEAIQQVKDLWAERVAQGARLVDISLAMPAEENQRGQESIIKPRRLADYSGTLKDNPLWDDWRVAVEAYRSERDDDV